MQQKYRFPILLLTALFFLFIIALPASAQRPADRDDKVQLPPDFVSQSGTILIQVEASNDKTPVALSTTSAMYSDEYINGQINKRKAEEYADKNLSTKHVCVSQREIYDSTGQYADKNTFRYALIIVLIGQDQHIKAGTSMQSTYYQPIFRFRVYDRLNNKVYAELGNGSSIFMWGFKSAIKKIGKKE